MVPFDDARQLLSKLTFDVIASSGPSAGRPFPFRTCALRMSSAAQVYMCDAYKAVRHDIAHVCDGYGAALCVEACDIHGPASRAHAP